MDDIQVYGTVAWAGFSVPSSHMAFIDSSSLHICWERAGWRYRFLGMIFQDGEDLGSTPHDQPKR